MVLETHMKLCEIYLDFPEIVFWSQNWENGLKIGPKQGFLNLLRKLVIDLGWICSIMKICIICCVPIQIPYLGKKFFLRYGPKCYQPIRLREFLVNHISWAIYWNSLIFCMLIQVHINEKLIKNFLGGHGTQSKILGGFVTFYPIHFGHFKCGRHWGYPKYCYSKPGWKDYTIKLKRNGVMRLPNYLDIEESVVLRFLRLPSRRLPCLPLLQG